MNFRKFALIIYFFIPRQQVIVFDLCFRYLSFIQVVEVVILIFVLLISIAYPCKEVI